MKETPVTDIIVARGRKLADAPWVAVQGCRPDCREPTVPGIFVHGDAMDAGEGKGGSDP